MDIAQNVSFSGYTASVYNKIKSVSQVEKSEEVKELSEEEKLAEFKKEIWREIDSMPWGCDISIHITDDAFKRMMDDSEFKDRMLNTIREDASVSGFKGGGTILNITESGYSGFSWMEGYQVEKREHLRRMSLISWKLHYRNRKVYGFVPIEIGIRSFCPEIIKKVPI